MNSQINGEIDKNGQIGRELDRLWIDRQMGS